MRFWFATRSRRRELESAAGFVVFSRIAIEYANHRVLRRLRLPRRPALIAAGGANSGSAPEMTAAARRGRRNGAKCHEVDAVEIARIAGRDDDLPAL